MNSSQDQHIIWDKYEYDCNGNVTAVLDWQEAVSSRLMTYDNLDRLLTVSASGMWGTATYTYDALDNLRSSVLSGGGTARTATHHIDAVTNRLVQVTNSAGPGYNYGYGYDGRGNIISRGSDTFGFDLGNRLTSATAGGLTSTTETDAG